jgi:hypothetical protein
MSDPATAKPMRFVPDEPFPPYSFVPRQFPHPMRDPAGHGFRLAPDQAVPLDPNRWHGCRPYLYGIDLFNHGYYWEAHEVWESLWHACGRTGLEADFLRALIRLAAAGVKVREGKPVGIERHATAAKALFQKVALELGGDHQRYCGLPLSDLCRFASEAAQGKNIRHVEPGTQVAVIFPFVLQPA